MTVPVVTLREDLSRARRLVGRAEGELAAVEARKAVLEASVGAAKGRLALKPKVDAFLEELQAEAHQKRVGDFERLLTAVVQEVLPGEFPIGLDLQIERGQPSLDIVSRRRLDQPEDIYDDQGGALTNVVSMGLRVIAAVRSNTRRFLVLDESDCWIRTDRVPSFYKVLTDAAGKLGVQCFVISHHDIASFGGTISVATLAGDKDMGVRVENSPRRHRWQPTEEGIASIRLRNFQSFVDETVHLTPGVNALVGPNNLGKSALVRALRAVFQGECRDSLIRHGERGCTVDVTFANGRTLRWDRQLRRNPINAWKLLGPDGAVVTENGMTYETGGRTAPEWVGELFGIGPVEGLDVHVVKQKNPVFLLDKPGSTRAAVLSIGQESSHIRTMIQTWKDDCAADTTKVRDGEREMSLLRDRLERFATLPELRERLEAAEGIATAVEARRDEIAKLEAAALVLERSRIALEVATAREGLLAVIPAPDALRLVDREAVAVETLRAVAERVASAAATLARDVAIGTVAADLPTTFPTLLDGAGLATAEATMVSGNRALGVLRARSGVLSALPATTPVLKAADPLGAVVEKSEAATARAVRAGTVLEILAALPQVPVVDAASSAALEGAVLRIETGRNDVARLVTMGGALFGLPQAEPVIDGSEPIIRAGLAIREGRRVVAELEVAGTLLASLPDRPPILTEVDVLANSATKVERAGRSLSEAAAAGQRIAADLETDETALKDALAEMGNACPVCGCSIEDPAKLLHAHTANAMGAADAA